MYAPKQLSKDRKLFIIRVDKSDTTPVMNISGFKRKVNEHLYKRPYENIKKNKCRATLNKLKTETAKMLQSLKSKLGLSLWFSLYAKSFSICRFYGLRKIHKIDVPLRQLVDYTNSSTNNLHKHLADILKPYESEIKFGIRNSSEFKDFIITIHMEYELMVSFGVCSLFTNVPIRKDFNIAHNLLDSNT